MSTAAGSVYEWKDLPWRAIERHVFKLQTRIYHASQRGDVRTVHRLQRLLTHSRSAKCLAVRRVTQDNRGKKTAGIDGVKALTPANRLKLTAALSLCRKARPVRRIWIPKPHVTEKRPLGIPVLHDRAAQALLKLALEPEWEARFEPNSYGFRPGRSCHDAIGAIFNSISRKDKYVLDADIAKCFDHICHEALLRKLGTTPTFRRVIRQWLKAGMMEGGHLFPTEEGTPQGGVISPLLMNVALHGMEQLIASLGTRREAIHLIRYADDLVVFHSDRGIVEQAKETLAEWLQGMGLELKPEKTRIVHTFKGEGGHGPGFTFLGFHVRHYPSGKHRAAKDTRGRTLGFTTSIRPSKDACTEHQRRLKGIVRTHPAVAQAALIHALNPVVRGWSAYYATVVSSITFTRQDNLLFHKLQRWAKRRHKDGRWWEHYWRESDSRDFRVRDTAIRLAWHCDTPIKRHVKVQAARSPYDGDWAYWSQRLRNIPGLPHRVVRLLREQQGKCVFCGLLFTSGDIMEVDHIVPRTQGGASTYDNLQLLHRHCHDTKSAHDKQTDN